MNIAIVSNAYPPYFIGGAELIAHQQALFLKRAGHNISVFAAQPHGPGRHYGQHTEIVDGIAATFLRLERSNYHYEYNNFAQSRIDKIFREWLEKLKPDIVHFHNIVGGLSINMIAIANSLNAKTFCTLHDHWGFCIKNTLINANGTICNDYDGCYECLPFINDNDSKRIPVRLRRNYVEYCLKQSMLLITPSTYLARAYIKAGFDRSQVQVLWNGIDIKFFDKPKKKNTGNKVRFTFVGYLGEHKGILLLLEAVKMLTNTHTFHLSVIGDGHLRKQVEAVIAQAGLVDKIVMHGKLPNEKMADIYSGTDVLILPSIWPENQPVTITEAMASRCAVIATKIGGIPELVTDRVNGFLFSKGKTDELAACIEKYLNTPILAQEHGLKGHEIISKYDIRKQVSKLENIYQTSSFRQHEKPLLITIASSGFTEETLRIMSLFETKERRRKMLFTLADWIPEESFGDVAICIVPEDAQANSNNRSDAAPFKSALLLVHEANAKLKESIRQNGNGLYYKTPDEASEMLVFLANMTYP